MDRLQRVFRPRSIAVVGGGEWGRHIIRNSRKIGFEGEIWPIHPKLDTIEGVAACRSVADIPGVPDVAFIAVNRHRTIEIAGQLSALGCSGAVCFASGFLEAEAEDEAGADLQRQLLDAAGEMIVIGPNCYGFVNYLDGAAVWPDQHGGRKVDRGVAILSQSSNMAINITMQQRGLPLAYIGTVGNQAQTGLSVIGASMLSDPRVTALGLHIEGVDDIRAFEALAATARDLGKSIVVLKVGASEQAQAATVSHTASLAGSDAGASALFDRLGIARVQSLPALLETLKVLHVCGPLPSNKIASMSCSGGEASLMGDTALRFDLEFPELIPDQKAALRDALGPMVALSNPLDYHTYIWRDRAKIGETFTAMMKGEADTGVIVLDFPRQDRCQPAEWYDVTAGAAMAMQRSGKQMAIVASMQDCMPEAEALKLMDVGIIPLMGMDDALEALSVAAKIGRERPEIDPVLLPGADGEPVIIGEADAKDALAAAGVPVPQKALADSPNAAAEIAAKIGFPVVVKGTGLAHKTEAGAVHVNLTAADQVSDAARAIGGTEFLVEAMVTDSVVELLVGVVKDPAHGFVLTLGAGGQLTELMQDSASVLIPASRDSVDACLQNLRCNALIDGYRGKPAADRAAILGAVMAIQGYVISNAEHLSEIEVNPLIATTNGAYAADALLRKTVKTEEHR